MSLKDEMLSAIKKELSLRQNELQERTLKSLYFGGGTPSLLSSEELSSITDEVLKFFDFDENIEVTLEANPDDLGENYLKNLSKTVVNRLSIGTQSFFDDDLKLMNRAHNASQAEDSIKRAQDFGFHNISIDLIYGSPTSNLEIWKKNLAKTIELQIPHVSSYALTVEPKTALQSWIAKGKISAPKDSEQNEEFYYMSDFLRENGFEHYEISNFAKPGFHSKHNSAYWQYRPYLGLGPSAHSYNGQDLRSWNIANNSLYIKYLANDQLPSESEKLSARDQFNEMLMIGLRTRRGVDVLNLEKIISKAYFSIFLKDIQPKIEAGLLVLERSQLKIPELHWFLADGIAADLFML